MSDKSSDLQGHPDYDMADRVASSIISRTSDYVEEATKKYGPYSESIDKLSRTIISLSSGILALTITFAKTFLAPDLSSIPCLLLSAWIALIVALISALFGHAMDLFFTRYKYSFYLDRDEAEEKIVDFLTSDAQDLSEEQIVEDVLGHVKSALPDIENKMKVRLGLVLLSGGLLILSFIFLSILAYCQVGA